MNPKPYDSEKDTRIHIAVVQSYLMDCCDILTERGLNHDKSKLKEPEKSFFDKYKPLLDSLPYGSDEYKQALEGLQPGLTHHYDNNSHHPEHYGYLECNGCFKRFPKDYDKRCDVCSYGQFQLNPNVDGMNLFDVLEMLMDWKAASEKQGGDIQISLAQGVERFNISPQLASILENTIRYMGWLSGDGNG